MIFYINYHTTIIADTLHNGEMSMYNVNMYGHMYVVRCVTSRVGKERPG